MFKYKLIVMTILCIYINVINALPLYTKDEIKTHNNFDSRIWVTYKNGVYDITDFVKYHPGGNKILSAAGGSIEPFWNIYQAHNRKQIFTILENYRIGDLSDVNSRKNIDPFELEPTRDLNLLVNVGKPFNAETPNKVINENFITPNNLFFVRNHLPVPQVNIDNFKVEIFVEDRIKMALTLDDFKKKYKWHEIYATLQCAGNRRQDMSKVKEVKGITWRNGAISNAKWEGVLLKDLLKDAGVEKDSKFKHIHFYGLDLGVDEFYSASIPIEKAIDDEGDVLLALKMNGEDLPFDHGYPVRVIVPGYIGARSVKWLSHIKISEHESSGFWQQSDYKIIKNPSDEMKNTPALQKMVIQSAITSPENNSKLTIKENVFMVSGYAINDGSNPIKHVCVSCDGGKSWKEATIEESGIDNSRWTWSRWHIYLEPPPNAKKLSITSKAIDSTGKEQPESVEDIWNSRGLLTNSWHTIAVDIDNTKSN